MTPWVVSAVRSEAGGVLAPEEVGLHESGARAPKVP